MAQQRDTAAEIQQRQKNVTEEYRNIKFLIAYKHWSEATPGTHMRKIYWYEYCDIRDNLRPGETEKREAMLGYADQAKLDEMKRRIMAH